MAADARMAPPYPSVPVLMKVKQGKTINGPPGPRGTTIIHSRFRHNGFGCSSYAFATSLLFGKFKLHYVPHSTSVTYIRHRLFMSEPPLYHRGSCHRCQAAQTSCAVWVANGRGDQMPNSARDFCAACAHGWVHHQREGAPPSHMGTQYMNRGGHTPTKCGGFYSVRWACSVYYSPIFLKSPKPDITWSFATTCLCSAALRAHDVLPLTRPAPAGQTTHVDLQPLLVLTPLYSDRPAHFRLPRHWEDVGRSSAKRSQSYREPSRPWGKLDTGFHQYTTR